MKRISRFAGVFLFVFLFSFGFLSLKSNASADSVFDTSESARGVVAVEYTGMLGTKMKVGVTFNNVTEYFNYVPGTKAVYALTEGDGEYGLALFRNISGTSYKLVERRRITVKLEDQLAPYRASTTEITYAVDDGVGKKAAELCLEKTEEIDKVLAIHNYIAGNFSYDYDFAALVYSGNVRNYVTDTNKTLESKKGICYDLSALFAAMCRSQGIACRIQRGYYQGVYHAWNLLYINGEWVPVDITASIAYKTVSAQAINEISFVPSAENGYAA